MRAILIVVSLGFLWSQNRVGIGTVTPNWTVEVYVPYNRIGSSGDIHTSSTCVAAPMPSDGQQGILAYHLRNSAIGYSWYLWYGDPDGGYGVEPLCLEIWEYPDQWGGGTCCRGRLRIVTTYPTDPYTRAPVVLDALNRFHAYDYITLSDERLKTQRKPLESAIGQIQLLRPVLYYWKNAPTTQIGFIAQEVQQIFPAAVRNHGEALGIDYAAMVSLLTRATQELMQKIGELEREIHLLEQELEESQK
ncbi:MAG: tail fiber domain-containing protein [Bacteroidia bacterium]|nr:tail fiber domain-containing protein [Bacteroidia bacterium]